MARIFTVDPPSGEFSIGKEMKEFTSRNPGFRLVDDLCKCCMHPSQENHWGVAPSTKGKILS